MDASLSANSVLSILFKGKTDKHLGLHYYTNLLMQANEHQLIGCKDELDVILTKHTHTHH